MATLSEQTSPLTPRGQTNRNTPIQAQMDTPTHARTISHSSTHAQAYLFLKPITSA